MHIPLPERPRAALPRPHVVDRTSFAAIVEDAVVIGLLAQAATVADGPGKQPAHMLKRLGAKLGDGTQLRLIHPHEAGRARAAVAAARTFEAQAVLVPRGHEVILPGRTI